MSPIADAPAPEAAPPTAGGEYERERVPEHALKDWRSFLGMYAGEHAAGTEFMIGPLFLAAGVSAFDLIVGLFVGNLLAVLTWRFVTAPLGVRLRHTLYYQLERIAGSGLVKVYNLANGVFFCFLAGAMVTVAATAVGIPFGMEMPALDAVYPNGATWVAVVLAVGSVIAVVAASGYDTVARFANVAAPWMVLIFLACGIVAASQLGVSGLGDLWAVWGDGSPPLPGQLKFTFWHVVFFSWFCNAAMNLGMADLSVFRFADKASTGWTTAAGMYLGHYMAWIAAALLYAVYLRRPEIAAMVADGEAPPVAPGPMVDDAIGIAGLICVVVAGWTTANPTIYRAGLAFQAMLPSLSVRVATLIAGAIATIAGLFPAFAMQLLGFVALYGFVLAPMGAVIYFDHHYMRTRGLVDNYAERAGLRVNVAVLVAYVGAVGSSYLLALQYDIFLSFMTLPAWLLCGLFFLAASRVVQRPLAPIHPELTV